MSAIVSAPWLISLLVFIAVLLAGQGGVLQPLELAAYDWMIRASSHLPDRDRISILTITEEDIQTLGHWPIPNGTLAQALELVMQHEPRALGIDIYLDVPIPPGREALETVLQGNQNIIAAIKFSQGSERGVPPPSVLAGTEQLGFTDVVVDEGGIVRRGLLFQNDEETFAYSIALRLALLYLQVEGVVAQPAPENPEFIRLGKTTIPPFEPNDGGYVRADAAGYQFLLDYRDEPAVFPTFSLLELLDGEVDPALIRDRVVLVGVSAVSVKDFFFTPFSREANLSRVMPGVTLHAHIVSQLLRAALDGDPPVRSLSGWQEGAWLCIWSLLGGMLGMRVRSPLRFAVFVLGGLGAASGVVYLAFAAGWWVPLVPPAIAGAVSATGVTAYVSYREMQERAKLMNLFSRHIAHELAVDIWENRDQFLAGGHPQPQKLTATAFFSDVAGFTSVSEQLEPQALMNWLSEYMGAMTPILNAHRGVILRFIGDAIMAVFGVPIPRRTEAEIAEDAVRAVACALAMKARLIEHNNKLRAEGRPLVAMRIGIYTGPMIAGSIGDAARLEYNVHGDAVNTAARLEGFEKEKWRADFFADPCRIFIGEPTLERIGQGYATALVGEVQLKGKNEFTRIYRLSGRTDDETDLDLDAGAVGRTGTA